MAYKFNQEYAKLKQQHEQERTILSSCMSESKINELFDSDMQQLNKNRSYYMHNNWYIKIDDEIPEKEEVISENWLDEIQNINLLNALKQLSNIEIDIVRLHVIEQVTLKEIAFCMHKTYAYVRQKYCRSIKKIKNNF